MITPLAFLLYVLEITAVFLWTTTWRPVTRVLVLLVLLLGTAACLQWLIQND